MQRAIPTTVELAEAVREFLVEEVRPATTGRVAFLARVAANVLAMVERELELGPGADAEHRARLARLGVRDDRELAALIRDGRLDGRMQEVVDVVRMRVVALLRIANPGWLLPADTASAASQTE